MQYRTHTQPAGHAGTTQGGTMNALTTQHLQATVDMLEAQLAASKRRRPSQTAGPVDGPAHRAAQVARIEAKLATAREALAAAQAVTPEQNDAAMAAQHAADVTYTRVPLADPAFQDMPATHTVGADTQLPNLDSARACDRNAGGQQLPLPCTCSYEDVGTGETGPQLSCTADEACPQHGRTADPEGWAQGDAYEAGYLVLEVRQALHAAGYSPEQATAWCNAESQDMVLAMHRAAEGRRDLATLSAGTEDDGYNGARASGDVAAALATMHGAAVAVQVPYGLQASQLVLEPDAGAGRRVEDVLARVGDLDVDAMRRVLTATALLATAWPAPHAIKGCVDTALTWELG
jgi:hypothetical protein